MKPGFESLDFHDPTLPDTTDWLPFEFPYFGTIGDARAEQQSKENRQTLTNCATLLHCNRSSKQLSLHFQLSVGRRDRDIDNLADAIMPTFNVLFPDVDCVSLTKGSPCVGTVERMWVAAA